MHSIFLANWNQSNPFEILTSVCSLRFVASWIDTRKSQSEKAQLIILFDKYVPPCLDAVRTKFKKITPLPEINHVQVLCHLLNCLLTPANVPTDCPKDWYEIYFAWACVWAFGSPMFQDQVSFLNDLIYLELELTMRFFIPVSWLEKWIQQMVAQWIQGCQISISWNSFPLFHWSGNQKIFALDGKSCTVRIWSWYSTSGNFCILLSLIT